MREIKFRAWYRNRKIMSGSFSLGTAYVAFNKSLIPIFDNANLEVMQFTGLKDKNGKEIYEGDIFKADHDFGPGGMVERITVVSWCNMDGYQWNFWDLSTLEVIGNVCENPELLKEATK